LSENGGLGERLLLGGEDKLEVKLWLSSGPDPTSDFAELKALTGSPTDEISNVRAWTGAS
jgi:hypothetical protein